MNHYPHHIGDFDQATRHLSRIERSVYRDMMDLYYATESRLTLDTQALCRRILARTNEEVTAVEQVLNEFFTKTTDGWYNDRCEEEIAKYRTNNTQKALAGKASAEAKRLVRELAINGKSTAVEQPLNSVTTETERNDNGTSTNQNQNQNQEPIKEIKAKVASNAGRPVCPHQEIISLWHEILPSCPRIRDWTPRRSSALKARWDESAERQNLDYWRKLFEYISGVPFLMGQVEPKPGHKRFVITLAWLVTQENFAKVREGVYE